MHTQHPDSNLGARVSVYYTLYPDQARCAHPETRDRLMRGLPYYSRIEKNRTRVRLDVSMIIEADNCTSRVAHFFFSPPPLSPRNCDQIFAQIRVNDNNKQKKQATKQTLSLSLSFQNTACSASERGPLFLSWKESR